MTTENNEIRYLESLKNHVLLDVVHFLTPSEVLLLTRTSRGLRDVLDCQWDFWHHTVVVPPITIRHMRRLKIPRTHINRHFCVWHIHIWDKIIRATTFNYLLCSLSSYSFATGLVCTAFKRIEQLAEDEQLRYTAHKMQLHVMIAQHLLTSQLEDVEEVRAGLLALKVLSRPFTEINVNPDMFGSIPSASNSTNNLLGLQNPAMSPADCSLKALQIYQHDFIVVQSALDACTNLALRRSHALFLVSEGFVSLLTQILCISHHDTLPSSILIAGVNALRNAYDPLTITMDDLDQILAVALFVLRNRTEDLEVVREVVSFLSHLAVWQAPHMLTTELSEVLVNVISMSEATTLGETTTITAAMTAMSVENPLEHPLETIPTTTAPPPPTLPIATITTVITTPTAIATAQIPLPPITIPHVENPHPPFNPNPTTTVVPNFHNHNHNNNNNNNINQNNNPSIINHPMMQLNAQVKSLLARISTQQQ